MAQNGRLRFRLDSLSWINIRWAVLPWEGGQRFVTVTSRHLLIKPEWLLFALLPWHPNPLRNQVVQVPDIESWPQIRPFPRFDPENQHSLRDRVAYRLRFTSFLSKLSDKLSNSSASSPLSFSTTIIFHKRPRGYFIISFTSTLRAIRNTSTII